MGYGTRSSGLMLKLNMKLILSPIVASDGRFFRLRVSACA